MAEPKDKQIYQDHMVFTTSICLRCRATLTRAGANHTIPDRWAKIVLEWSDKIPADAREIRGLLCAACAGIVGFTMTVSPSGGSKTRKKV